MKPRRSDLIVPVRDRRQRRRLLTLRNVRNVVLVAAVAFAIVSIASEMRKPRSDLFGRLYERSLPAAPAVNAEATPIITEATPVDDQVGADPMLLEPAARGQWLLEETASAPPAEPTVKSAPPPPTDGDVAIVGGRDGIAVVTKERDGEPELSGGIFKRQ